MKTNLLLASTLLAATSGALLLPRPATAQTQTSSPASALKPGLNRVAFSSQGVPMKGHLFLPTSFRDGQKLPLVIVCGSWTTVKEQMADLYARRLSEQGLAAMTFDFRGFGESGGAPRQHESPRRKINDIKAATAWARTLPVSTPDRIGGLAICASAGYMAHAIAEGAPLKSFATVAAWLHDPQSVSQVYNGERSVSHFLRLGWAAQKQFRRNGQVAYVAAASKNPRDRRIAPMFGSDYYGSSSRGLIPQWSNRFAVMSWPEWLTFDAIAPASRLRVPTLLIHTDQSALPNNVRRFHAALKGRKDLLWTQGLHSDFYDREPFVGKSTRAVAAHFASTLGPQPAPGTSALRRAASKASAATSSSVERDARALAGTREFFSALEAMDVPRFLRVWAEDGVQEMPYAPGAFPKRLVGRAAIEKQYAPLPTSYTGMRFPLRRLVATQRPGVVVAEYDGSIGLKSGGRYDNRYVGIFEFNARGKLARFTEYFDPFTLLNGFPGAREAAKLDEK